MSKGTGAYTRSLAAVAGGGGALSVLNPEGEDLIVHNVLLDIKTPSAGACTLDVGIGTGATTSYDNLLDGISVAAAAVKDNKTDKGTNGKTSLVWPAGSYLTVSVASGTITGLVADAHIQYVHRP